MDVEAIKAAVEAAPKIAEIVLACIVIVPVVVMIGLGFIE